MNCQIHLRSADALLFLEHMHLDVPFLGLLRRGAKGNLPPFF